MAFGKVVELGGLCGIPGCGDDLPAAALEFLHGAKPMPRSEPVMNAVPGFGVDSAAIRAAGDSAISSKVQVSMVGFL